MKRILITGAGGSAAANFIKSLKMSPEKFYLVGSDVNFYHLELADVDKKYILPTPYNSEYLSKINKLIYQEKIDFIHAQPDVEVLFISRNRNLVKAKLLLPLHKTIELCQDKFKLSEHLSKNSVSAGESYAISNAKDLNNKINLLLRKNNKIWIRAIHGAGSKASLPVKNFEQANSWIKYWVDMKGLRYKDFMVTEFLPGKEYAFQSLWSNGELIISQARERIEYIFANISPSGQTSSPSVAVTVHSDEVNNVATKAILSVDSKATGIFCVDMKKNSKGELCVTEINAGRFFTTSNFLSEAGANMPYIYIKTAFGEKLPNLTKYNATKKDLYWIRLVDMGCKMVGEKEWTSKKI